MEDRRWKIEDGKMEDGIYKKENGRQSLEDGKQKT